MPRSFLHICSMYICFFVQISQFYEPDQRTLKLAVQRTAAALYANACLKPHKSLAAAAGSGHRHNHKKLRGGSRIKCCHAESNQ